MFGLSGNSFARIQRVSTASPSQAHSGASIPGTIHIDDSPYGVNLQSEDYFPSHQNNSPPSFGRHYPAAEPANNSGPHGLQSYQPLAQSIHTPHMTNALAPIMGQPSSHLTPNSAAMVEGVYQIMGNGLSNLPQGINQGEPASRLTTSQLPQQLREETMSERGRLVRFVASFALTATLLTVTHLDVDTTWINTRRIPHTTCLPAFVLPFSNALYRTTISLTASCGHRCATS